MKLVKIDKLYICYIENDELSIRPLEEGEPYKYLVTGDPEPYTRYHTAIQASWDKNDLHTIGRFHELIKSVTENGFLHKNPVTVQMVNGKLVIMDGQHRVAILKYFKLMDEIWVQ
jgi:hypothetical protein